MDASTKSLGWSGGEAFAIGRGPGAGGGAAGVRGRGPDPAFEPLEERVLLSTLTWDGNGGDGKNYVWGAWNNWAPARVPRSGDALVFAGKYKRNNWNNMSGLSIAQITVRYDGFNIDGNAITLGAGGIHFVSGSNCTIGLPLALTGSATAVEVTGSRMLKLTDVLSGTGGISKSGSGTAALSQASTFSGATTVNAGTLLLTGSLANSGVVVNAGLLTGGGRARSLTVNGGTVAPGAGLGTFTVSAGATFNGGTLEIQLQSVSSVDQLRVTGGEVVLGGRLALSVGTGFHPDADDVFALVNNTGTGATSGTFANFADGQVVELNGHLLRVRYNYDFAGDGQANDAVLARVNHVPTGSADWYAVDEDSALVVRAPGVLGNDSDADGDALTASAASPPAHGALVLEPDGSFTYTPDAGFVGTDGFTYRANDGEADSAETAVEIVVSAVNDPPVAADDAYATDEDTALVIAGPGVLGNDSDAEGDRLTASVVAGPGHGTLTFAADGSFAYTPHANFHGADSFTYAANDSRADSNVATVQITVRAVNDAPVAVGDGFAVNEDQTLTISGAGVLGNDRDVDGDTLRASVATQPAHGTLTLNANGSFTYRPNVNFNGVDRFVYKVDDGQGGSAQATATITVRSVDDANSGIHPAVLAWMLKNNPGLGANFLKTEPPDKVVLLPNGQRVQIYKIDQFLNVNFRFNWVSRKKEGIDLVEKQEDHLRKLLALPEFYHWIRQHRYTYRIAGKGKVSAQQAYNYLRNINRRIYVTASKKVKAPVGGGNGINAPSWAVWKQMNLFWHESCHVIGIGHNSGGLSGPLAGKLRQWDRQKRWDYTTIDINELEVPPAAAAGQAAGAAAPLLSDSEGLAAEAEPLTGLDEEADLYAATEDAMIQDPFVAQPTVGSGNAAPCLPAAPSPGLVPPPPAG
ncbi:MAG: Extracellular serine protease precursor [Planctomycetes bacterium ADurb.Bin126]|nr:MAG: Extracellular serine protease precursor [Planctomycetes bacterium ADurb.Bin126]HOD83881.1 tandem-95 repeat protein [Phycisphaerae bacterium]HQL73965.1 tandem-95 repeat protein [Phycisphaerae bacterium]